jgi:hypothetical protein
MAIRKSHLKKRTSNLADTPQGPSNVVEGILDYCRKVDARTWPSPAHSVTLALIQAVVLARMFEITEVRMSSTNLVDKSQFNHRQSVYARFGSLQSQLQQTADMLEAMLESSRPTDGDY